MYSSMLKKAEKSSIQYSRTVDAFVCVRALQMWVRALQMCVRALQRCVRALQMCVPARTSDVLACAHRLYENVDSAKIKVPFYTT